MCSQGRISSLPPPAPACCGPALPSLGPTLGGAETHSQVPPVWGFCSSSLLAQLGRGEGARVHMSFPVNRIQRPALGCGAYGLHIFTDLHACITQSPKVTSGCGSSSLNDTQSVYVYRREQYSRQCAATESRTQATPWALAPIRRPPAIWDSLVSSGSESGSVVFPDNASFLVTLPPQNWTQTRN